jgi:FkbM family methyltransferase
MRDYKREIAAYLNKVKKRDQYSLERDIQDIKHSKYVCVFGAGMTSYTIVSFLKKYTDIKIDFLCDNDPAKWRNIFHGNLVCISPDELEQYRDDVAIIIATQYYKEIFEQLRKTNFQRIYVIMAYRLLYGEYFKTKEHIDSIKKYALKLFDVLEDEKSKQILYVLIKNWFDFDASDNGYIDICSYDSYCPKEIIHLSNDEAFVDAGAYDGDTLLGFLQNTHNTFNSIYSFELDKDNFERLEMTVNALDVQVRNKIKLYNVGLLDEEKNITYETGSDKGQNSTISESFVCNSQFKNGKTARLSDIVGNNRITYIKMDIEGSELMALYGAEEIIKKQTPKLAICVYHKPNHLWEIPLYLKSIVPDYKIFLRHHSTLDYETVCYAVL